MFFQKLFGRGERVDPRPLAIPAGMELPETAEQKMARMIRTELSRQAAEAGFESFEDANDFDCPDDDPTLSATSHEMVSEMMEDLRHGEYEGPGFGEERDRKRGRAAPDRDARIGDEEERTEFDEGVERPRGARKDEEQRRSDNSRRSDYGRARADDRRVYESESRRTADSRSGHGRSRDED